MDVLDGALWRGKVGDDDFNRVLSILYDAEPEGEGFNWATDAVGRVV